ncbi:MAG: DUF721 domain-containing protein [Cyclobacteriaceae bacterium]
MKEDSIKSFKQAFGNFLKEERIDQKFNEKRLISMWGETMGNPIASRTTKLFIRDKILFVYLTSAPLKQELTQAKTKVLEVISKKIGSGIVEDVRFG